MPGDDQRALCSSCGQPVAAGEEECASCRTVPIPPADLFDPGEPIALRAPYPLTTRLVGPREPLLALVSAFERARRGGLVFVSLEGPPGSGKTRHLLELSVEVARIDARASFHLAGAGDASLPYGPVARIVGARLGLSPSASPEEAQARVNEATAELLPGPHRLEASHLLAHLLGAGAPDSPIVVPLADSPAKLEARLFLAIRRFLAADAARAPLVLCVDEAEQAGPDTAKLLHYLAAGLGTSPVLLIAAGRGGAAALRSVAGGEHAAERIELVPLGGADAETLLRLLLAPVGTVPDRLVAYVRHAPITPRAIVEVVRLLVESNVLRPHNKSFILDQDRLAALDLPQPEDDVTVARLRLLPPGERDLLDKAAVCGERFWIDALVALYRAEMLHTGDPDGPTLVEIAAAGDRTRAATAEALGRLCDRGWIVTHEGAREHRFAWTPLRDVVLRAMEPVVRRRHQRWVAQWLELRPDGREEDAQEEIGGHLEDAGDGDSAAACFRRAADGARARYFNEKAIRLYARALRCASRGNLAARIHLWHDLGSVYELKGDFEAALGAFERMLRLTWIASSRSKAAVAFNKLGRVWRRKGNLRLALDYLERGLALFEQAGDGRGVAGSLDDIGHVLYLLGRYDEAHAKITRALARRGKHGDKRSIAHSLSNLGNVQKDRGRLDEAQACHAQALDLRREIADRAGVVTSMHSLAALAFERGQRDDARQAFEQALDDAERIGALPLQAVLLCSLGEVALVEGKIDEARRRLTDALGLGRELDDRRVTSDASRVLGLVELTAGNQTRARELCARALALAEETGLRDAAGRALLALAEVASATLLDDGRDAELRPFEGGEASADELYARGIAVFREIGNTSELARGLARRGRHKIERGQRDAARPLLEEARALYARLGLPAGGIIPEV